MASTFYNLYGSPCGLNVQYNAVEFPAGDILVTGKIYYLEFDGGGSYSGCFLNNGPSLAVASYTATTVGAEFADCPSCEASLVTPTPTSTPTNTPTNTSTVTNTPTNTPTNTSTNTPTKSVTPTNTPTQSVTPTNTPTQSVTPTKTTTPTNTQTTTKTPTPTPTNTPTKTTTPTNTPTQTKTPTQTATNTPTQTVTPTNTSTPTPTPTPFGTFDVNENYEYGPNQEGSYSGGTWDAGLFGANPPHPIDWVPFGPDGQRQGTVVDLSAITLGGPNGLNN